MPEENNADLAALCAELSARVERLEVQLAEEQEKNAVLNLIKTTNHSCSIFINELNEWNELELA